MQMHVMVCVKQVMDVRVPLRIAEGGCAVRQAEPEPVWIMDPAARCALEKAMALKRCVGARVTAITVGPHRAEEVLTTCLARGADSGVHILCPEEPPLLGWEASLLLCAEIGRRPHDLVLCGERSLDQGSGLVGPALAEHLGLPQVTRVVAFEVQPGERQLIAERLLEHGDRELVQCPLPALITVTATACRPQYVSVHRHLRVRERGVERVSAPALGGEAEPMCRTVAVDWPRPRPKKIAAPAACMSAAERMRFLMTGGQSTGKREKVFEGSLPEGVEVVISFLQEHGFL